jgi:hypothetical protein
MSLDCKHGHLYLKDIELFFDISLDLISFKWNSVDILGLLVNLLFHLFCFRSFHGGTLFVHPTRVLFPR